MFGGYTYSDGIELDNSFEMVVSFLFREVWITQFEDVFYFLLISNHLCPY